MPSPFPGMNPYLEQEDAWHDFHGNFLEHARAALNAQLLPRYFAKVNEQIYVHDIRENDLAFLGRSDVHLAPHSPSSTISASTGVLEAPVRIRLEIRDLERVPFIEIRDRRDRVLVTVVELLSPSNKRRGPDRDQYLAKRDQVLGSSAHFVELDLLRRGPRMPMKELPECDYCVMVSRVEERPTAGIWPFQLRDPMPLIPIPLLGTDEQVTLDLQAILHQAYDAGGYEVYIYESQPEPPLAGEDTAWARQYLRLSQ